MMHELCRTVLRQGGPSRLHVRRARLELVQAIELLVDPLESGSEDLLALQRLIGAARKALAARLGFAPQLPLLLPCERTRLVALLPQAQLQPVQLVGGDLVDGGMVRDANQLKLVMAQPAALQLASQRHWHPRDSSFPHVLDQDTHRRRLRVTEVPSWFIPHRWSAAGVDSVGAPVAASIHCCRPSSAPHAGGRGFPGWNGGTAAATVLTADDTLSLLLQSLMGGTAAQPEGQARRATVSNRGKRGKHEMADRPEIEWPRETRDSIGEQLSVLGKVGFFIQLALLAIPVLLAVYVFLLGRSNPGSGAGIDLRSYVSFASVLVMMFTTYWFFRYIKLGQRMRDPARHLPRSAVVTTLWVGLWAGCLGIAFSMLLLLAAAWRILFVLLTNPQSGMLIAPTAGTNPTYSLSAIDAVSLTLLIISLGAELMVLGLTLWLLFRMTWPSATTAKGETEMSA
jgi:uncharacterized protein DUF3611